jgi:hypothetical protein
MSTCFRRDEAGEHAGEEAVAARAGVGFGTLYR